MSSIFIAGLWFAKKRLKKEADKLAKQGHTIVSSWLSATEEPNPSSSQKRQYALRDWSDLRQADLLILDTLDEDCRGGREAEWGMALEMAIKNIWIVGPKRSIYHELCDRQFLAWSEVLEALKNG